MNGALQKRVFFPLFKKNNPLHYFDPWPSSELGKKDNPKLVLKTTITCEERKISYLIKKNFKSAAFNGLY